MAVSCSLVTFSCSVVGEEDGFVVVDALSRYQEL